MSEHNPWDRTIWDPINPEQAIEDPMHGTAYLDSQDRPVFRIGSSTMVGMREGFELQEWLEAHREGDEALTALEAKRQQSRLGTNLKHPKNVSLWL